MRHVNYALKPATIDNAKPREKAYALTDGGGLQLEVLPSGSKTWRFKYHLNGKREKVTIGAYLWVCPSGFPRKPLFALPEHSQPGRRIVDCEGIGVAVSGLRMVENFLDMGHFPYVHANYLGEGPQTEVAAYDVSVDEFADEIWATNCRFYQPKTSKSATTGLEVEYRYRVMQPMSAVLYKSAFTRPGEMDAIGLFIQPHDEEHITAYCLLAYFDDDSRQTDLISFQHTIFGQDKPILENQRPKRMPLQLGAEIPTRCDAMSVAYRRWLIQRGTSYGALR